MNFISLGLAPELQQAIDSCGYSKMTEIQAKAIIPARQGKDILANAQTGTGKTAAYSFPILQQMLDKPKISKPYNPRTLILAPTRELAEQLGKDISNYAQFTSLSVTAVYGGSKIKGQKAKLKNGVDILIATPARLIEHVTECNVNLANVEFVVLDEADRMLDMGFIADVQTLMQLTAKNCQKLLFSATISHSVNELSHKILRNHVEIKIGKRGQAADTIEHVMYPVEEKRKLDLFMTLLNENNWYQVLVFVSTKSQANQLLKELKEFKIDAAVCHADKSHGARRRALADFKSTKLQVLIATEVAARGLDIEGLEHVVNYNLPYLAEDYVHRIGRTGRAEAKGNAISFVSREEEHTLHSIERLIGSRIKRINRKGFEVGDRRTLLKNIVLTRRSGRTNKTTQTKIIHS